MFPFGMPPGFMGGRGPGSLPFPGLPPVPMTLGPGGIYVTHNNLTYVGDDNGLDVYNGAIHVRRLDPPQSSAMAAQIRAEVQAKVNARAQERMQRNIYKMQVKQAARGGGPFASGAMGGVIPGIGPVGPNPLGAGPVSSMGPGAMGSMGAGPAGIGNAFGGGPGTGGNPMGGGMMPQGSPGPGSQPGGAGT